MSTVVGREPEIAVVHDVLTAAESGLVALEIVGEPGIGKTTVWEAALRRGRDGGARVLAARPAESESKLSFAGLTDLFADVGDDVLGRLPPPQRDALRVALLRVESGRSPDRRLVGTALLSVLRELVSGGAVVLAVDDAQWLDSPSASALEFALRRLGDSPLRVVMSLRADATRPDLRSIVGDARVRSLALGPLSVAAIQRIINDRFGVAFPRPTLVRITEASRGNAFYGLEIARLLLASGGEQSPSGPLPVPADLRTLVAKRIESLPVATRHALLRAAALARPDSTAVDASALAVAEDAELVTVDARGAIEFTHPLFASAVYGSASARERSEVHRALVDVVRDPEERARHSALASTGPDESTARTLELAAQRARARGAPDAAAELAGLALGLTPSESPVLDERRLALAEHLYRAGDFQRSADVLEELIAALDAGDLRARALLTLADIDYWRTGESEAVRIAEAALRDAVDPLLQARCYAAIAMSAGTSDLPRAADAAQSALELLEQRDDAEPALVSLALSARVRAQLFLGYGLDREAAEHALELEAAGPQPAVDTRVVFKLGQWLRYVDDLEGSRRHLALAENAARDEGDESSLANILLNRTLLECWSGDWPAASALARRTQELFELTGVPLESSNLWRAYVDAHYGRVDAVHVEAERARDVGEPIVRMLWERTLGLAELAAGELAAADRHFGAAVAARLETGFREPAVWRIEGDAIEAALGVGDIGRAETLLVPFEESAARSGIAWSLAVSARCRGLLYAAQGELEPAAGALERSLAEHERCPVPFELARTLLAHGQVLRRLKQKRRARDALTRALAIFDELGAEPWSARARDEQRRTAARAAPAELSPTELRIARLAAAGLTNQAIAAEVFVTRKTVEANLGRAYRKLGIRSRAQLARALDAKGDVAIP